MECGPFSITPTSDRISQNINTFDGQIDLVALSAGDRLIMGLYETNIQVAFGKFDYRQPSAWTPDSINFQDAGSGVGIVSASSSVNASIGSMLHEWSPSDGSQCSTIGGDPGSPDGAINTGTRGSQPTNPTNQTGLGSIQGRGTDRPTYPIPEDFDPEREAKSLQQGGDCGCSRYTYKG